MLFVKIKENKLKKRSSFNFFFLNREENNEL